jgi:hypothetical protein
MKTLSRLFRSMFTAKPTATRRPRSVKLGIEGLEERMVQSASSFNMHAVVQVGGTATFFHTQDNVNNPLVENTGPGAFTTIAPAGAVTDFSAGLDPAGHAALFAHMNGVMQEFTQATGWVKLNEPVPMAHFAAVDNGDLYAVGNDHSLWQFTPLVFHQTTIISGGHIIHGGYYTGGWSERFGPNSFISVDAVTSHGQDIVVAMNYVPGSFASAPLSWYVPATGYVDSFSGSVDSYSVGLDTAGYFDVFVVIGNPSGSTGQLQQYDPSQGGWQPIINTSGSISPLAQISATSGGQCFVASIYPPFGNGPVLWEYSPNHGFVQVTGEPLTPGSSVMDISAASADNLILMDTSGALSQYTFSSYYNADAWRSLSIQISHF